MSCGGSTQAPKGYLADTQDNGAIVLDSKDGPLWMDEETRPFPLDVEEGGNVAAPHCINAKRGKPTLGKLFEVEEDSVFSLREKKRSNSCGGLVRAPRNLGARV